MGIHEGYNPGNSTYQAPLYAEDPESSDPATSQDPFAYLGETDSESYTSEEVRSSILLSVKDALGLVPEYKPFDSAIIMHINTVFGILFQLGVGSETDPYSITGETEQWSDFICQINTEFVRSYMYTKVRLLFDPPSTATMYESFSNQVKEMEWRLRVAGDEDRYANGGRMDLIYGGGS